MEDYGSYGKEFKSLPGEIIDMLDELNEEPLIEFYNPQLVATIELVDFEGIGKFWVDKFTGYIFLNDEEIRQAVYQGVQSGIYFQFRYFMEPRIDTPVPNIF